MLIEARRLKEFLLDSGILKIALSSGCASGNNSRLATLVPQLPSGLQSWIKFLFFSSKIPRQLLNEVIPGIVLDKLIFDGIIDLNEDKTCSLGNLTLRILNGYIFLAENTSSPEVYFGEDSVALFYYNLYTPGKIGLDLCSGSGIQAITMSGSFDRVIAVEINCRACSVAKLNVALNGLTHKIEVVNNDNTDFLQQSELKFSHICFNPPLLPGCSQYHLPFVADGGVSGMEITNKIVSEALPRLALNGSIEFIGVVLSSLDEINWGETLSELIAKKNSNFNLQATLTSVHPLARGETFFDSLVLTSVLNTGSNYEQIATAYESHFRKLEAKSAFFFSFRIVNSTKYPSFVADLSIKERGRNSFWIAT
jgi:methylase of polypeptide subunit release factors